jgi:hypothetical protein
MQEVGHALMEGAPFSFFNVAVLGVRTSPSSSSASSSCSAKYRVNSTEFMAQIRKLVQAGNIDRAIKLCEAAPLPLLQVVKSGAHAGRRPRRRRRDRERWKRSWAELHPAPREAHRRGSGRSRTSRPSSASSARSRGLIKRVRAPSLPSPRRRRRRADPLGRHLRGHVEHLRSVCGIAVLCHDLPPHPERHGQAPEARDGEGDHEAREPADAEATGLSQALWPSS